MVEEQINGLESRSLITDRYQIVLEAWLKQSIQLDQSQNWVSSNFYSHFESVLQLCLTFLSNLMSDYCFLLIFIVDFSFCSNIQLRTLSEFWFKSAGVRNSWWRNWESTQKVKIVCWQVEKIKHPSVSMGWCNNTSLHQNTS